MSTLTISEVAVDQRSDGIAISFGWSGDVHGCETVTWSILGLGEHGNVIEVGCVRNASGQLTQFVLDHATGTMTSTWVNVWVGKQALTARFSCRHLQDVKFEYDGAIKASVVVDSLGVHDEHRFRVAA